MLQENHCCQIATGLWGTGNNPGTFTMSTDKQFYLHSRHDWTGIPSAAPEIVWTRIQESSRTDTFPIRDIRDCVLLKLSGFVQEQQAEITDVRHDFLRVRIGGSRLRSLVSPETCPLDLEIRIDECAFGETSAYSQLEVVIHDCRWIQRGDHFKHAARRALLNLKHHLMAIQ